jgi:hypothetical protein
VARQPHSHAGNNQINPERSGRDSSSALASEYFRAFQFLRPHPRRLVASRAPPCGRGIELRSSESVGPVGKVAAAHGSTHTRVGAIPSERIFRYKWLRSRPNACAALVMFQRFSSSLRRTNSRSYADRASCKLS